MNKHMYINDLNGLRKDILTKKKPQFKRLYEQCELSINQHLSEEHPPMSITFMGLGSLNLSLMYLLTK